MDNLNDGADSAMQELEERTETALRNALEHGTSEEDVRLLCYHAGIKFEHVKRQPLTQRKD